METYKLKLTKLQNRMFRLYCNKAGSALNQSGTAHTLHVSPTAVAKSLEGLEKEGLIKVDESPTMNLVSIQMNRDNPRAVALKRIENLRQIYESGLVEFLSERYPGCTIVLFGSYSTGEDVVGSDIDIAVIGTKGKPVDLARFEKSLERTITLHFYEDFKIDKNLKSNIINGITLNGALEL